MAIQRDAETVLTRWREIERQLTSLPDDSREAEALRSEAAVLRDLYQLIVSRKMEEDPQASPIANGLRA